MADPPPSSPTVALLALARGWEAALAEGLEPLGLTVRRYGLLGHVRGAPGISFSELARRARITVQSTHTAVAALARDGLVDDATALAGAASSLRVTAAGDAVLERAGDVVAGLDRELTARHPDLADALRRLVAEGIGRGS